jgi:hypothetical protein
MMRERRSLAPPQLIDELYRRKLPHWRTQGATYFDLLFALNTPAQKLASFLTSSPALLSGTGFSLCGRRALRLRNSPSTDSTPLFPLPLQFQIPRPLIKERASAPGARG